MRLRADGPDGDADAEEPRLAIDARLAASALSAWLVCALALQLPAGRTVLAGAALLVAGPLLARRADPRLTAVLLASAAAMVAAGLRLTVVGAGPVPQLAAAGAAVDAQVTLTSDPVARPGRFGDVVVVDVRIDQVTGRGVTTSVRSPAVVFADDSWLGLRLGSTVRVVGRLERSTDPRDAAVLIPSRLEGVISSPSWWWNASGALRGGIREGVARAGQTERELTPALVDGDDSAISPALGDAFRVCGLTHLLAVSGTNLTIVLAFLLTLARWLGARGYLQVVVGTVATVGFVVLARPEPSVLRAAAMGLVAVAGLGAGGRRRGVRALSVAVLVLVLVDPWLARSAGFTLSVLATAGILLLAPPWRDALAGWLPRSVAEAIAVPMAAQVACTPVVAVLSGQVSLVAVVANMLVAPVVAPATVLGLVAGLVALVCAPVAHVIGWAAAAMVWWIVTVAEHGAALPGAAMGWGTGPAAIVALSGACIAASALARGVLRRPVAALGCVALTGIWVVHPISPGWPPDGWVLVSCDVGQGDGLVLDAGPGAAVVVDTGPDPALIDRCLDRLGVDSVPLVVLTHPHADHVDGLSGVADGRDVGAIEVGAGATSRPDYAGVLRWAAGQSLPVREVGPGLRQALGRLSWTVLAPVPHFELAGVGDGGAVNDSSVVLSVQSAGITLLLTGDVEPSAQSQLEQWGSSLHADVLKVPHHGSRYQDPAFLADVGASLAIVSVGADNDYGHPAPETIALLQSLGETVLRTDEVGDVAVVVRDGAPATVTR
ncbi:MAG: ComEC/Rec2 family competence protein [Nocardioidaceae bacterium]